MSLIENTLFGCSNKINDAIDRLRAYEPIDGYYVAFSGGKDSIVIKKLCELANVKFEAFYNVTSVDPPELVRYIKVFHPDVKRIIPKDSNNNPITMWNLIPKKLMPPTRLVRYCCKELKESSGNGRLTVTGVRWAESSNRKNNQGLVTIYHLSAKDRIKLINEGIVLNSRGGIILNNDNDSNREVVETCYRRNKTVINPIIDWSDDDVWEFIEMYNLPYCNLYNKGYKRLGCIGCPMSSNNADELDAYPKYKDAYLRAFARMLKERSLRGLDTIWKSPDDVMNWWLFGNNELPDDNQITMDLGKH